MPWLLARFGDLCYFLRLNRLAWWAYDLVSAKGWEGFDTFITLRVFESGADETDVR